jgi:protein-disulfide isomerase
MRGRLAVLAALVAGGAALLAAMVVLSLGKPDPTLVRIDGVDAAQRLFGGIRQEGEELGDAGAPVEIAIFNDLQCKGCALYHLSVVPRLVEDLVRPGRARLVFRHFPMGSRSRSVGAFAAAAAAEQGRAWEYVHLFFANQNKTRGEVTDEFMRRIAGSLPRRFDIERWERDRRAPEVARSLAADADLALELRLTAMPAAVIEGPAGRRVLTDSPTADEIERAVEELG